MPSEQQMKIDTQLTFLSPTPSGDEKQPSLIFRRISLAPDIQLQYVDQGKGPVLLLLHELGLSLNTFRYNMNAFSSKYRVIALDLPGFGGSSAPDIAYCVRDFVEILAVFLDALGIEKAHILGVAEGAVIALSFARLFPSRVDKLLLLSPGGITYLYPRSYRVLARKRALWFPLYYFSMEKMAAIFADAYFDRTRIRRAEMLSLVMPYKKAERRRALHRALRAFFDDPLESLSTKPSMLLIFGEFDKWHPPEMHSAYRQAFPFAPVLVVRNCGHAAHLEKPVDFNRRVLDFLEA